MKDKADKKKLYGTLAGLAVGLICIAFGDHTRARADGTEPTTVKMMLFTPFCSEEEFNHVLEKINERLIEQLQLKLDITSINSGNEALMKYLMDNPDADIIYTGDFQEALNGNLLLPLDDLLESSGQGILSVLTDDYLSYRQRDGKQYGLPRKIEMASARGIVMRTDLLEKYEIDPETIQSWDDVGEALGKITANEPEIYGIVADIPINLEDSIMVVEREDGGLEAVNYFETEDFREWTQRMYDWGQKGYLYDLDNYRYDVGATRGLLYELMREGSLCSYMVQYKPGIADQEAKNYGLELTQIQITPQVITSNSYQGEWGIYSGSAHPEEAMKILNFLYTDKEINNLFCWGIEGEHYLKNEDGMLVPPEQEPESPYFFNRNWMLPNGYSADVWEGDLPNLQEEVKVFNEEAEYAADFGFWFDDSRVQVEMEKCMDIINAYLGGFVCGKFNPDEMIPAMLSELESAGIDRILQEKQRQLEAWEEERQT